MNDLRDIAAAFLDCCETGKGWDRCRPYCHDDAGFASQAEPVAEMQTVAEYTQWMHDLFTPMPNASYELKSLAVDPDRDHVIAFAVFRGTHSGESGPVPATGASTESDYAYVMAFREGRIAHLTKIWNAGWAMRQLGWT